MNAYSEDLRKKIVEAKNEGCLLARSPAPSAWASPL